MAGSLIDEFRAWFNDTVGQHLLTRPSNSPSDPLNVTVVAAAGTTPIDEYGSVTSIAASTLTTILTYTVPVGDILGMDKVEVSGCNVATFTVEIDTVVKGTRRTYWGKFNADFEFFGYRVAAGSTITVRVIHERPNTGNFEATLLGELM